MSTKVPLIIAHRGGSGHWPENTLPAFRSAFEEWGADMIELDVQSSKDGIPVIFHDRNLERLTNAKGQVSDYSLNDLKKLDAGFFFDPEGHKTYPCRGRGITLPSLEETLYSFKDRQIMIELKTPRLELLSTVISLVKKYRCADTCLIGSQHHSIYREMRGQFPKIRTMAYPGSLIRILPKLWATRTKLSNIVAALPLKTRFFDFSRQNWIDRLHANGIPVFYWTINDPDRIKELAAKGADGIISDDPGLLKKTLQN